MRFLTIRELRAQTGSLQALLAEEDIVLTTNGRPTALVTRVDEAGLEEVVRELRLARARSAVTRLRRAAAKLPAADRSSEAIAEEVAAVRRGRS